MSTRCVACDKAFKTIPEHPFLDGVPDDMCSWCRMLARSEYAYSEDHEFILENASEGVTEPKDMSFY